MMQNITVGKYLRGIPEKMHDGTYFDILEDTMLFVLFISNPTKHEIEEFHHGEAQFAMLNEDGLIFFLAKFGELPWVDAPYNKYLATEPVDTTRPEDGQGYSITMILTDARDSKVMGIRVISLFNKFSNLLMDAVENQPYILRYDDELMKKFEKYSSSEEMSKAAIKEEIEIPRIKKNSFNIGYFYSNGKDFGAAMGLDRVHCDYCNTLLKGEDRVTVIPFLNGAYCEGCEPSMLEDCKAIDEREEKYKFHQEKYFREKFRIK